MNGIFLEIGAIIVIATLISVVMKVLRQPLIIGYIITGVVVSPYFLDLAGSKEVVNVLSQIGVALLLFIVGLSLNPKVIKDVGKVAALTGIGQVVFTSIIGFFIARLLGYSLIESAYIAVALTFSSTIIIMKLLSDKNELDTLYGRIAIGFLLVQDLIAFLILMAVSSASGGKGIADAVTNAIILGGILLFALYIFSAYLLPRISGIIGRSQEFLFLFSLGWMFALAALFDYLNFSIEIGALLAGITLSVSRYHYEISAKVKPLRDFFLIMFFIVLGAQLEFGSINGIILPALILSAFVLFGNPLIVMIIMGMLGYTRKNSFLAGLTVAQISEFSLILIVLGINVGHLSPEILLLVTIVGLVTIAGSTYMIMYSNRIYPKISKYLKSFERPGKKVDEGSSQRKKPYDIILIGYNRVGFDLLKSFKRMKKSFLVVDYNPEVIAKLTRQKYSCKYGDANDAELLDELDLKNSRLIVSTIPVFDTNMLIIKKARDVNRKAIVIAVSHQIEEALLLYEAGASYVLMPHFLGGQHASLIIEDYGFDEKKFSKEKLLQLKLLNERMAEGHEHPKTERNQ